MSEYEADLPSAEPLTPLEERVQRLESEVSALREANSQPAPLAVAVPVENDSQDASYNPATPRRRFGDVRWLLVDLVHEANVIIRMFVDLRYRVAWSTRILTIILLVLILSSAAWNPFYLIPYAGNVLDNLLVLILAYVMYKVLSREAARYMESQQPR